MSYANAIADNLIYLRYSGTGSTHTITVDGDGGTSAGLVTLTDDDGANAFDLGDTDYDTLGELVAAINALGDWEAKPFGPLPSIALFAAMDISADSLFADQTATTVPTVFKPWLVFTDVPISIAAGVQDADGRGIPISVKAAEEVNVRITASLASGSETNPIDVSIRAGRMQNSISDPDSAEAHAYWPPLEDGDFDTSSVAEVSVNANGTTEVKGSSSVVVRDLEFLVITAINNQNSAAANVEVEIGF